MNTLKRSLGWKLAAAVLAAVLVLIWSQWPASATPFGYTEPGSLPDFGNQYVLVYSVYPQPLLLERTKFANYGSRIFIVGVVSDGNVNNRWAKGLPVAIPWDQVDQYMILAAPEDYRDRLKASPPRR